MRVGQIVFQFAFGMCYIKIGGRNQQTHRDEPLRKTLRIKKEPSWRFRAQSKSAFFS